MRTLINRISWLVVFATLIVGRNGFNLKSSYFDRFLPSKLIEFSESNRDDADGQNFSERLQDQNSAFEMNSAPPENAEEDSTAASTDNEMSWANPTVDDSSITDEDVLTTEPDPSNSCDLLSNFCGIWKQIFGNGQDDGYGIRYLLTKGSRVIKSLLNENPRNLVASLMKTLKKAYNGSENRFKTIVGNLLSKIMNCPKPEALTQSQQLSNSDSTENFKDLYQKVYGIVKRMLQEEPLDLVVSSQRIFEKMLQSKVEKAVKGILKPKESESFDGFGHLLRALYKKTLRSLGQTPKKVIQSALQNVRWVQNMLRTKLERAPSFYERYMPRVLSTMPEANKIKLSRLGRALLKSISTFSVKESERSDESKANESGNIVQLPRSFTEKPDEETDSFTAYLSRLFKKLVLAKEESLNEAPKTDEESAISKIFDENLGISKEEYTKIFKTLNDNIGPKFAQSSPKSINLFVRVYLLLTRGSSNSFEDHLIELHVLHTLVLKSIENDIDRKENEYVQVFGNVCQTLFGPHGEKFWKNWRYFPNYFQDAWKRVLNEKKYEDVQTALNDFQTGGSEPTSNIQQSVNSVAFQKIIPIGPNENLSEFQNWHQFLIDKLGPVYQKSSGVSMYVFIKLFKNLSDIIGPAVNDELGEIYALHTFTFNKWRPQILSDIDAYIEAFVKTAQNVFGTKFENITRSSLLQFSGFFYNIWSGVLQEKEYKTQSPKGVQVPAEGPNAIYRPGLKRRLYYQDEYYNQILSELGPRQPMAFDYDILREIPPELIGTLRYIGGKYFPYDERNFFELSRRSYKNYMDRYSYNPIDFLHHLVVESSNYYDNPTLTMFWPNIRDFFNDMYWKLDNKIEVSKNRQKHLFTRFLKKVEKQFRENSEKTVELAKNFLKSMDEKISNITKPCEKEEDIQKSTRRLGCQLPVPKRRGMTIPLTSDTTCTPSKPMTTPNLQLNITTTTNTSQQNITSTDQQPMEETTNSQKNNITTTITTPEELSVNSEDNITTTRSTSQQNVTTIIPVVTKESAKSELNSTTTSTSQQNATTTVPDSTKESEKSEHNSTTISTSQQNSTTTVQDSTKELAKSKENLTRTSTSQQNVTTIIPVSTKESAKSAQNSSTTSTSQQNVTTIVPDSKKESEKSEQNSTTTSTSQQNVTTIIPVSTKEPTKPEQNSTTTSTSQQNAKTVIPVSSKEFINSEQNLTTTSTSQQNVTTMVPVSTKESAKSEQNLTTTSNSQQNVTTIVDLPTEESAKSRQNSTTASTSQHNVTTVIDLPIEESAKSRQNSTTTSTSQQNVTTIVPVSTKESEKSEQNSTTTSTSEQNVTTIVDLPTEESAKSRQNSTTTSTSQHNVTTVIDLPIEKSAKSRQNSTTTSTSQQNVTTIVPVSTKESEKSEQNSTTTSTSEQNVTTIVDLPTKESAKSRQNSRTTSTSQQNVTTIIDLPTEESAKSRQNSTTTSTSHHNVTTVATLPNVTVPNIVDEADFDIQLKSFFAETHLHNFSEIHKTVEDRWLSEYNKIFILVHGLFPGHEGDHYAEDVYRLMKKLIALYGENHINFDNMRRSFVQVFADYYVNSDLSFEEKSNVFAQKVGALSPKSYINWSYITRNPSYLNISDLRVFDDRLPQTFDVVCVNVSLSAMGKDIKLLDMNSDISDMEKGTNKFLKYYVPCYKAYLFNTGTFEEYHWLTSYYHESIKRSLIPSFFKSLMRIQKNPAYKFFGNYSERKYFNYLNAVLNNLNIDDEMPIDLFFLVLDYYEKNIHQTKISEIANKISEVHQQIRNMTQHKSIEGQEEMRKLYGKYFDTNLFWLVMENPIRSFPNKYKSMKLNSWRFKKYYDQYIWSFVDYHHIKSRKFNNYFDSLTEGPSTFHFIVENLVGIYNIDLNYCDNIISLHNKTYKSLKDNIKIDNIFVDAFVKAFQEVYGELRTPCYKIDKIPTSTFISKFSILYENQLKALKESKIGKLYEKLKRIFFVEFEKFKMLYAEARKIFGDANFNDSIFEKAYRAFNKSETDSLASLVSSYDQLYMKQNPYWHGYNFNNLLKTIENPDLKRIFVQIMEELGDQYEKAQRILGMLELLPYTTDKFVHNFIGIFKKYGIESGIEVYQDEIFKILKVQYMIIHTKDSNGNTTNYVKVLRCAKSAQKIPFYVEKEPSTTNAFDVCENPKNFGLVVDQKIIDKLDRQTAGLHKNDANTD